MSHRRRHTIPKTAITANTRRRTTFMSLHEELTLSVSLDAMTGIIRRNTTATIITSTPLPTSRPRHLSRPTTKSHALNHSLATPCITTGYTLELALKDSQHRSVLSIHKGGVGVGGSYFIPASLQRLCRNGEGTKILVFYGSG